MVGGFVVEGMAAGPIPDHPQLTNPFGVDSPLLSPLDGLSLLLIGIGMIGCVRLPDRAVPALARESNASRSSGLPWPGRWPS